MTAISRRQFAVGLSSLALPGIPPTIGQSSSLQDDPRVAIIDVAFDTTGYVERLTKVHNIAIVARYYAREPQWKGKRIVDNVSPKPEWEALREWKIGIISIYQYNSSNRGKFLSDLNGTARRDRKTTGTASGACAMTLDRKREAFLDANAAFKQAQTIGQPENTPIYFGADFNLDPYQWRRVQNPEKALVWRHALDANGKKIRDGELTDAVYNYFYALKCELGDRLGVYGNGYTCDLLQRAGLVRQAWVSESRSFETTATYLREGRWYLFQNQIDRFWFPQTGSACSPSYGLSLDTNIQNPDFDAKQIGAWGDLEMSPVRTKVIFDRRQIARTDVTIRKLSSAGAGQIEKQSCKKFDAYAHQTYTRRGGPGPDCNTDPKLKDWCLYRDSVAERNRTVRVVRDHGEWLEVDSDDDGITDGFCPKNDPSSGHANFVASIKVMPDW